MRIRTLALLAFAPVVVTAGPSEAAPFQIVTTAHAFVTSEVTVLEGSTLELTNLDIERHDVTSLDRDATGRPLFASGSLGTGEHAVVEGVDVLAPSVYPFYCATHPDMVGNLTVA